VPQALSDFLGERQSAMSCENAVCSGRIELAAFHNTCRGSKDKPVDALDAAVNRSKASFANLDIDPARQSRHPCPRTGIKLCRGMGKPGGGELFALTSCGKAAAAIGKTRSEALLAISHDNVTSAVADKLDSCRRVGAVGHDVTGTDDTAGRNAQRARAVEQRPGCFQIAVGTAEEKQRTTGPDDFFRADHIRIVSVRCGFSTPGAAFRNQAAGLTMFCMLSRIVGVSSPGVPPISGLAEIGNLNCSSRQQPTWGGRIGDP
jgi:hypothetical protein